MVFRPSAVHTEFDLGVVLVDCAPREEGVRQAILCDVVPRNVEIELAPDPLSHTHSAATTTRQCEEWNRPQARFARPQNIQASDRLWFLVRLLEIDHGDAVDNARTDGRSQEVTWLLPELAEADLVRIVGMCRFPHRLLGGGIHFHRSFRDVGGKRECSRGAAREHLGCAFEHGAYCTQKISDVGVCMFPILFTSPRGTLRVPSPSARAHPPLPRSPPAHPPWT